MPNGQTIARRDAEETAVLSAFNEIMELSGLPVIPGKSRQGLLLVLRVLYHTGGRDALAETKGAK